MMKLWKLFYILFCAISVNAQTFISYKVEQGDELMTISYKFYGTHQKWQLIVDANPELNIDSLVIGQEIRVPKDLDLKASDRKPAAKKPMFVEKKTFTQNTDVKEKTKSKKVSKQNKDYQDLKDKYLELVEEMSEEDLYKEKFSDLKDKYEELQDDLDELKKINTELKKEVISLSNVERLQGFLQHYD